ncbi:hypothetical protein FCI58_31285, partial [Enterobacter hormaechei]|nr:hypothetical protein [Enterobacter hormaechei]
ANFPLGCQSEPAPASQRLPVSVGVDSLDNLRTSIYNMTRVLNGELDPRQFFTNEKQQGGFFDPLKGANK